jgi:hypothetical protein
MFYDWLEDNTWYFWHVVMTLNAVYVCYQKELNNFAFGLAEWNLFIFGITMMVLFG